MKKLAILCAALSLIMVTSCKEKGPVESPSFSSYGKTATYAAFTEKKNELLTTYSVLKTVTTDENSAPSFSYSSKLVAETKSKKTRSGDGSNLTLTETTINLNEDNEGSYDSNNEAFAFVEKYKNVINEKYTGGQENAEDAYTQHINRQYQKTSVDGEEKIGIFNIYLRTFTVSDVEGSKIAKVSSQYAYNRVLPTIGDFPSEEVWEKYSDTRKADFKFYVDDKVLTMVYTTKIETEQKEVIGGEEKVTLKTKTETKRTNQVVSSNKDVKYRTYEVTKSSVERIDYFTNRIISETVSTEYIASFEGTLTIDSKVSVKLEDSSSYKEGNDIIEN